MKDLLLPKVGSITKTAWALPAKLTQKDWQNAGQLLSDFEGALMWWIGDWWNYGEHQYGERKALVNGEEWRGPSWDICRAAGNVCNAFETARRRAVVSFNHHRECASLPPEEADKILDWCEETQPTIKATRERVKQIKAWLAQGWTTDQLERKAQLEAGETVVASKRKGEDGKERDAALIAWADQQGLMVEIDRGTAWGNPFETPADGSRKVVCSNYRKHYLPYKPSLLKRIADLRGKLLVCWCYPDQCHGDSLIEELHDDH